MPVTKRTTIKTQQEYSRLFIKLRKLISAILVESVVIQQSRVANTVIMEYDKSYQAYLVMIHLSRMATAYTASENKSHFNILKLKRETKCLNPWVVQMWHNSNQSGTVRKTLL